MRSFLPSLLLFAAAFLGSCDQLTGASTGVKHGTGAGGGGSSASDSASAVEWQNVGQEALFDQQNFKFHFRLEEDGAWVELVAHSSRSPEFAGGIELRFERIAGELHLRTAGPNLSTSESANLSSQVPSLVGDSEVLLFLDIHNNEAPAHLLFWFPKTRATLALDCSNCNEGNTNLQSDDLPFPPYNFPFYDDSVTQGLGSFWTVRGTQGSELIGAEVRAPIAPH